VSVHRQPTAFIIGQTDPAAQVRAEDAVFFDQIGNRLLPLVGPLAGHRHHEESNRSDIHDRGSLHYRLHGTPESPRPRSGHYGVTSSDLELTARFRTIRDEWTVQRNRPQVGTTAPRKNHSMGRLQ
jgi:hypothetical protein